MAIDVVAILFGPLLAAWAAFLVYLAVSGRRRVVDRASTLGLGRGRLAHGYLAVFVVCLASAYLDTLHLGTMKVARGDVTPLEAEQYFWGWYISVFSLATALNFFLLSVLGLPALALLRRVGLMSIVGACVVSQILALGLALLPSLLDPNDWCRSNGVRCLASNYADTGPLALTIALAFALAARLPLLRWTEHGS